ncbi:MAG: PHP domain-containing protein [Lachnospiraceae bacterium]|nr:PHP domain-containing protein [Lachnospiraceae bacterium]
MHNLHYDLHIHSCLSPCGDNDMTPGNIVGMAVIKELDVIALTDHNSCRNTPAAKEIADAYGIILIPGMELTTSEDVHVLCLFSCVEDALTWNDFVDTKRNLIPNDPAIFGDQLIMNSDDQVIGHEENLLINATNISFDECYDLITEYKGVMIPAHIDKDTTSLMSNLGFVPPDSKFKCVEVKNLANLHKLKKDNPYLEGCRIITDSDAHYLEHIHEPEHTLAVSEKSIEGVLKALVTY